MGIEVGRISQYRCCAMGMDTMVRLRESIGGRERQFWLDELEPLRRDQVEWYNKGFQRSDWKHLIPMDQEPLRHIEDMAHEFIWCHVCSTSRNGRGNCPKGCKEPWAFGVVEYAA